MPWKIVYALKLQNQFATSHNRKKDYFIKQQTKPLTRNSYKTMTNCSSWLCTPTDLKDLLSQILTQPF